MYDIHESALVGSRSPLPRGLRAAVTRLGRRVEFSRRRVARLERRHRLVVDRCALHRNALDPARAARLYWVDRGRHTRRGTFTAVLRPISGAGPRHGVTVEAAIECWWSWRHPNMLARIAGWKGTIAWLDFLYPETFGESGAFAPYRERYDKARRGYVKSARL